MSEDCENSRILLSEVSNALKEALESGVQEARTQGVLMVWATGRQGARRLEALLDLNGSNHVHIFEWIAQGIIRLAAEPADTIWCPVRLSRPFPLPLPSFTVEPTSDPSRPFAYRIPRSRG